MSSDDIVERLRGWVPGDAWNRAVGEMREAADEIERLRAELAAERADQQWVERLMEQNDELSTRHVELLDALDATRFERDRLRTAGDALAEARHRDLGRSTPDDQLLAAWQEARRER